MDINKKKIEKFLEKKNIPVCQLCNNNEWEISTKLFQLLEFDTNGLVLGGDAYPVVPITCNHCGNTLFVNAIVAGLIDKPDTNSEK